RWSRHLDCFESLHRYGASLRVWRIPVIPALAALFFFQLELCAFAWGASGARREGWLGVARLVSFPAAGLAIYVLLSDYLVAKATSASAILVSLIFLGIAVLTVVQGLRGARLRAGGGWTLLFALCATLLGFLLFGGGSARREIARVLIERETQKPDLLWPDFAPFVPRAHAAALGDPLSETEVLLFVDLEQESSRALVREALRLIPAQGAEVLVHLYAPGEPGAHLILAQQRGELRRYLQDLVPPQGEGAAVRLVLERQERARDELKVTEFPTAIWKNGRRSGALRLRDVLAAASRRTE
ncbi:MAG: hypothetical protein ACYTFD_15040, partial [Planctomycetota bacterium]